jgi:hypothetical protein
VANNFSTIGFDVASQDDFVALARVALEQGDAVPCPLGEYLVWSPGGGAQLIVQVDRERRFVGANPHFMGPARILVAVTHTARDQEHPMDGYLHAWAGPTTDDPESGDYPFVVDLPDFDAATDGLGLPAFGSMQIAAFARTLVCWPDDATYTAAEDAKWAAKGYASGGKVRGFSSESFIPSGTFSLGDPPPGEFVPKAEAIFTGHVLHAEVVTNGHTGVPFHHLVVRTLGGEYDVVADPTVPEGNPVEGGVVQGTFWLVGRLV